jgi:hypothetical protein
LAAKLQNGRLSGVGVTVGVVVVVGTAVSVGVTVSVGIAVAVDVSVVVGVAVVVAVSVVMVVAVMVAVDVIGSVAVVVTVAVSCWSAGLADAVERIVAPNANSIATHANPSTLNNQRLPTME